MQGEVFRDVCFALGQTGEVACGGVERDGDEVAFFGRGEAAGRREKDVAGRGCSDFCSNGSVFAAFPRWRRLAVGPVQGTVGVRRKNVDALFPFEIC